jgi:hypothetical protein
MRKTLSVMMVVAIAVLTLGGCDYLFPTEEGSGPNIRYAVEATTVPYRNVQIEYRDAGGLQSFVTSLNSNNFWIGDFKAKKGADLHLRAWYHQEGEPDTIRVFVIVAGEIIGEDECFTVGCEALVTGIKVP